MKNTKTIKTYIANYHTGNKLSQLPK